MGEELVVSVTPPHTPPVSSAFMINYRPHYLAPRPLLPLNLRVHIAQHESFAVLWPGFPCCQIQMSCSQTQVLSYQTVHTFPSDSDLADARGSTVCQALLQLHLQLYAASIFIFILQMRNLNTER